MLSGASVTQGELEAVVTAVGRNTFFGKTIALLGAPEESGHLQKVRRWHLAHKRTTRTFSNRRCEIMTRIEVATKLQSARELGGESPGCCMLHISKQRCRAVFQPASTKSARAARQVLGKVTVAFGVFAFVCVLAIFVTLLARGEPVGYSIVVFFVIYVSVVPIGASIPVRILPRLRRHLWRSAPSDMSELH